jgi:acid stress-induced BolA-like protein IbaG/YrbA
MTPRTKPDEPKRTKETGLTDHPTNFQGSIIDALTDAIETEVPDAKAEVTGGGGHFSIEVTSPAFAGKSMLQSQRMVYSAIAHLMKGDQAPVHAVDSLRTQTPAEPTG